MTKTNTYKTNKQTNAREAHRQAPSSPSEVITMLKGMTKHEDKEHGKTLKDEVMFIVRNDKNTESTHLSSMSFSDANCTDSALP